MLFHVVQVIVVSLFFRTTCNNNENYNWHRTLQEPILHLSRLVSVGFAFAFHLRKSSIFAFTLLLFTVLCFAFFFRRDPKMQILL